MVRWIDGSVKSKVYGFLETTPHTSNYSQTCLYIQDYMELWMWLFPYSLFFRTRNYAIKTNLLIIYNFHDVFLMQLRPKPAFTPIFILIFHNGYILFLLINVLCIHQLPLEHHSVCCFYIACVCVMISNLFTQKSC